MLVHTGRQGSQGCPRLGLAVPPSVHTRAWSTAGPAGCEQRGWDPGSGVSCDLVSVTFLVLDDSDTPGPNWQTSCVHDINAA